MTEANTCKKDVLRNAQFFYSTCWVLPCNWLHVLSFCKLPRTDVDIHRDSISDYTQILLVSATRLPLLAQYHIHWSAFRRPAAAIMKDRFPSPHLALFRSSAAVRLLKPQEVYRQLLSVSLSDYEKAQYRRLYQCGTLKTRFAVVTVTAYGISCV